jgi:hypothetical protein
MTTDSSAAFAPRAPECAMGEHDWRIDPFTVLTSSPARRRVVCVDCGQISSRPMYAARPEPEYDRNDPRTWPHVD